jgi:hypothetical protein
MTISSPSPSPPSHHHLLLHYLHHNHHHLPLFYHHHDHVPTITVLSPLPSSPPLPLRNILYINFLQGNIFLSQTLKHFMIKHFTCKVFFAKQNKWDNLK